MAISSVARAGEYKQQHDPFEPINRIVYGANKVVDKLVVTPVAKTYEVITPQPLQGLVSNFFGNLKDVPTVANGILQGKFAQATSDTARFVINSTIGLLGFFDVAKHLGLAKHKEDFGQTLGAWGWKNSSYIVLPLFGPSTLRDTLGRGGDFYVSVTPQVNSVRARNQLFIAETIDKRTSLFEREKIIKASAVDEYTFIRNAYLQYREFLISDGAANDGSNDEFLEEPPE